MNSEGKGDWIMKKSVFDTKKFRMGTFSNFLKVVLRKKLNHPFPDNFMYVFLPYRVTCYSDNNDEVIYISSPHSS